MQRIVAVAEVAGFVAMALYFGICAYKALDLPERGRLQAACTAVGDLDDLLTGRKAPLDSFDRVVQPPRPELREIQHLTCGYPSLL